MNNNDLKYQNYIRKKVVRFVVICLSILTIFLEAIALFQTILYSMGRISYQSVSYVWGLIPFCLTYLVKYFGIPKEEREKEKHKKEEKKVLKEKNRTKKK